MHNLTMFMYDGSSPFARAVLPLVQDMIRNNDAIAELGKEFKCERFETGYAVQIDSVEVVWYDNTVDFWANGEFFDNKEFQYHEVFEAAKCVVDFIAENLEK